MDDKIKKLGEHFSGFDVINDYGDNDEVTTFKLLRINIPNEWDVFSFENEKYTITPSRNEMPPNMCGLYGVGDIEFSNIFDFALEIIKHNKDKEEKVELYQKMVDKLYTIFNENNIEKLKKLKFSFSEEKPIKEQNNKEPKKK